MLADVWRLAQNIEYSTQQNAPIEIFQKPLRRAKEKPRLNYPKKTRCTAHGRRKPFDEVLENRFWNTLYRFGYAQLNSGRQFRIVVGKGADATEKQVDVFAMDEETVVNYGSMQSLQNTSNVHLLKRLKRIARVR